MARWRWRLGPSIGPDTRSVGRAACEIGRFPAEDVLHARVGPSDLHRPAGRIAPGAKAKAAEIETRITPEMAEMGCTLRLSGQIAPGEAQSPRPALEAVPPPGSDNPNLDLSIHLRDFAPGMGMDWGHVVFTHRNRLDSPGGDAEAADEIVTILNRQPVRAAGGVPTAIARGDRCAGVCARVFFAGRFAIPITTGRSRPMHC